MTARVRRGYHANYRSVDFTETHRAFRLGLHTPNDDERVVDECISGFSLVEPSPEPLETTSLESHRTGTCFDVESTEMREACVDPIREYLNADVAIHEVRHQRSGYHTDLVYAVVDPEKVHQKSHVVVGDDPIHDPLQRFKVWWYLVEYGPKLRNDAIEDGRYSDPSTNRKHVDWLLDHGYVARTSTDHLVGVRPPEICELHAVELKLRNWERALEQAARANRGEVPDIYSQPLKTRRQDRFGYADYRWVALDAGAIDSAIANLDQFRDEGVGLLAVAEGGTVVEHLEADYEPRGRYTRDRAYVESQVWNRIDLDAFIERARETAEPPFRDNTSQPSLTSFDGGDGR